MMKNLLCKDFKLGISPFFYFLPVLTGALMLIPGWLYFIVLMYFCFITVPNMFATYKVQNDLMLSIMMPVTKKDIVKSRMLSVISLELLHIMIAVFFAIINNNLYDSAKFIFLEPNIAFFGLIFIMFALFNIIFFPMFYKTAYKYGAPVIVSNAAIIIFASVVELLALFNPSINMYLRGSYASSVYLQVGILGGGVLIFIISAIIAYKISVKRFCKVDI